MVESLVNNSVNVNLVDARGISPLVVALKKGAKIN